MRIIMISNIFEKVQKRRKKKFRIVDHYPIYYYSSYYPLFYHSNNSSYL